MVPALWRMGRSKSAKEPMVPALSRMERTQGVKAAFSGAQKSAPLYSQSIFYFYDLFLVSHLSVRVCDIGKAFAPYTTGLVCVEV